MLKGERWDEKERSIAFAAFDTRRNPNSDTSSNCRLFGALPVMQTRDKTTPKSDQLRNLAILVSDVEASAELNRLAEDLESQPEAEEPDPSR